VLIVGLTGGIGSGKSAVSRLLAAHGAVIIDADLVAREVVAAGSAGLAAIAAEFGPQLVLPDGTLDRAALGVLVFPDPERLAALNAIVHPLVGRRTADLTAQARDSGAQVLVHDVPLLVENGLAPAYDVVVVVDVPPDLQLERLVGQRGMEPADARARIARQATREQRLAVADEVIVNTGSLDRLAELVEALWVRLLEQASG